jgi:hypothetical protein
MPVVYLARCANCAWESGIFPGSYWAALVDPPVGERSDTLIAGAVVNDAGAGTPLARQDDPRFVVIAHPIEGRILTQLGHTFGSLGRTGRLFQCHRVSCPSCGTLFDQRRLSPDPAFECIGCFAGALVGVAAGLGVGVWLNRIWLVFPIGGVITLLALLATGRGISAFLRYKYRDRIRQLDGPDGCPVCGTPDPVPLAGKKDGLMCPACRQREVTVRSVGMS